MTIITIDIEVLIVIVLVLTLIIWFLLHSITKFIHRWRYKPENDQGRRAEESRKETRRGEGEPSEAINLDARHEELGKPELLQTTGVDSDGKDSKKPRGFFARRKR